VEREPLPVLVVGGEVHSVYGQCDAEGLYGRRRRVGGFVGYGDAADVLPEV
jgi:hypothetical protein